MFAYTVERWRPAARTWAAWAASRYGVALDESDLLALISRESAGNPAAVSATGYRGLGQVGQAALGDYNASTAGVESPVTWADMIDPAAAGSQIRVIAWLVANGRRIVSTWSPPDARSSAHLWADARYSWGGGHLKSAIGDYQDAHGRPPTFDELAQDIPDAGKPYVRPWVHARAVAAAANADREVSALPSFQGAGVGLAVACDPRCCAARSRGCDCPRELEG